MTEEAQSVRALSPPHPPFAGCPGATRGRPVLSASFPQGLTLSLSSDSNWQFPGCGFCRASDTQHNRITHTLSLSSPQVMLAKRTTPKSVPNAAHSSLTRPNSSLTRTHVVLTHP